jgi:hypothetical protein
MANNNENDGIYKLSTAHYVVGTISRLLFWIVGAMIYSACPNDGGGSEAISLICCPELYVIYKVITQAQGSKWPAWCWGQGSKGFPWGWIFVLCCCVPCCCFVAAAAAGVAVLDGGAAAAATAATASAGTAGADWDGTLR